MSPSDAQTPKMEWDQLRALCQKPVHIPPLYEKFDAIGLHYGKQFQTLRKIWIGKNEFIAELEGDAPAALIDSSFQTLAAIITDNGSHEDHVFLPYSIDQIVYFSELGPQFASMVGSLK